jgi:hypothetical protein
MTEQPPTNGKVLTAVNAVKGLSLTNVLIIFLLVLIGVPTYVVWKAIGDDKLMDRLMSTYEEYSTDNGCLLRHVQERGGPDLWGVSSGFAYQGADRWFISVVLPHEPKPEEVTSYCESVKLIADRLVDRRHDGSGNIVGP